VESGNPSDDVKAKAARQGTAYKIGFWFLLLTLIGFVGGLFFAQHVIIERRLADAVKLQGIVIGNIPYDLKAR
jgi:hypothetical protein